MTAVRVTQGIRELKVESRLPLGLWRHIQEDWATNARSFTEPGFQAVATYHFGVWAWELSDKKWVRAPFTVIYNLLYIFVRNVYGIELHRNARVGRRFRIAHQHGIVISPLAQIGDDCIVRQNVTIGQYKADGPAPTLGNGVDVGAGAVLVGPIRIGDGARIGPNAVITTNVPAGATAFAPPARVISPRPPVGAEGGATKAE